MARVKRGVTAHARHKKVLGLAKGYRGRAHSNFRIAIEKVEKGLRYAYRDRRAKKRNFRALWIQRINAGARDRGPDLFAVHERPEAGAASSSTARCWPISPCASPRRSRRSSPQAQAARSRRDQAGAGIRASPAALATRGRAAAPFRDWSRMEMPRRDSATDPGLIADDEPRGARGGARRRPRPQRQCHRA